MRVIQRDLPVNWMGTVRSKIELRTIARLFCGNKIRLGEWLRGSKLLNLRCPLVSQVAVPVKQSLGPRGEVQSGNRHPGS